MRHASSDGAAGKTAPASKRILSVWFPRLAVERALLEARIPADTAAAAVAAVNNAHILASLTAAAEMEGLYVGQPLRDALAISPALVTCPADVIADAKFLSQLRRFADKYSPWIADDGHSGLTADVTGCAHLFGGEAGLLDQAERDYSAQGLTTRTGMADTPGAAWALARFAGHGAGRRYTGDDIDQEARATRSRAAKRWKWTKTRPTRQNRGASAKAGRISPPGGIEASLSPLPLAALRLSEKTVDEMARLGIRTIGQLLKLPRGEVGRRFDMETVERIDQALGIRFEPVSPARRDLRFAVRLSLPEPVGLQDDILAGLDRLLPELCERLKADGRVARRVRLELLRVDGKREVARAELARPADAPPRIRPLLEMKLGQIDVGGGVDALRLEATLTEPVPAGRPASLLDSADRSSQALADNAPLDDLISRLGARTGLESITRFHPADSHIPEKSSSVMAAAWSEPDLNWEAPANMRPAFLFQPEIVYAPDRPSPPKEFRWRRRFVKASATGPERIMPEWWLDDPNWRSGTRDYWRVETECGSRLWLFYAYGGEHASKGWFCHGDFG